jgi:hypothetical protein
MPADYEMMIAASPPVFSHSPPASSFLATNYNYLRYGPAAFSTSPNRHNINATKALSPEVFAKNSSHKIYIANMAPRRPCLVVRGEDAATMKPIMNHKGDTQTMTTTTGQQQCPHHAIKNKKKVCFADDKGMSLTQVRTVIRTLIVFFFVYFAY